MHNRHLATLTAVAGVILFMLSACSKGESETDPAAERAAEESHEALQAIGELADKKRREFVEQAESKLSDLEQRIGELKDQLDEISAEKAAELNARIEHLQTDKQAVEKKLETLRQAGADAWDEMKKRFSKAAEELGEGISNAKKQLETEQ